MAEGLDLFYQKNPHFKTLKQQRKEQGLKLYNKKNGDLSENDMKKRIAEIKKQWQIDNKEYFNQLVKKSYYKNIEKRREERKRKVECPWCNKQYSYASLWGHKKNYCKKKPVEETSQC